MQHVLFVADEDRRTSLGRMEAIAQPDRLGSLVRRLLDLFLRFLAGQFLGEHVKPGLVEPAHRGLVGPLHDEQGGGRVGAKFDRHHNASARQLIEQLGPFRAQFLLEVADELIEAAGGGGVVKVPDRRQGLGRQEERVGETCLQQPAWLLDLDKNVRLLWDETERIGRRFGAGSRGEQGQTDEAAPKKPIPAHEEALHGDAGREPGDTAMILGPGRGCFRNRWPPREERRVMKHCR